MLTLQRLSFVLLVLTWALPAVAQDPVTDAKPENFIREPDVIYVPTPQDVVDKMLDMARPKKSEVLYDLGCGDGRIVVTAAKKYGVKAVGFDIDPDRIKEALANVKENGVEDLVTIKQQDIFKQDLSKAGVITLYLLPELNVKLIPQLEKLAPARIVSHDFRMKGVRPNVTVQFESKESHRTHKLLLWTTPLAKQTDKDRGKKQKE